MTKQRRNLQNRGLENEKTTKIGRRGFLPRPKPQEATQETPTAKRSNPKTPAPTPHTHICITNTKRRLLEGSEGR